MDIDQGSLASTSRPVRIRRPSTKFSDANPNTTREALSFQPNDDYTRASAQDDRPRSQDEAAPIILNERKSEGMRDRPPSSLLERLNMEPVPQVSHGMSPSFPKRPNFAAGRRDQSLTPDYAQENEYPRPEIYMHPDEIPDGVVDNRRNGYMKSRKKRGGRVGQ